MNGECYYCYVVNSAIYNNIQNPDAVDKEAKTIIEKSKQIADGTRKVVVVLGINAPEATERFPKTPTETQMKEAVQRVKSLSEKLVAGCEDLEVRVIGYRWERFDERFKPDVELAANERINYLAIRNNLFYSDENHEVLSKAIEDAKKHPNASIKLLALDGDSETSVEAIRKLEEGWSAQTNIDLNGSVHLPPLITSGFYRFDFTGEDVNLIDQDGNCKWGLFLANIENLIDLESKIMLKSAEFKGHLLYKKLSLPSTDEQIDSKYIIDRCAKFQKNLFLLDKVVSEIDGNSSEFELLKIHFCDILAIVEAYKEAENGSSLQDRFMARVFHTRIINELREIEKLEKLFVDLEQLSYSYSISGEQVLYPSENVLFVSLFDKVKDNEFNVYAEIDDANRRQTNRHKLWGDDVGREEGENIAAQMRHFWVKHAHKNSKTKLLDLSELRDAVLTKVTRKVTQDFAKERDMVNFAHVFKTALPPRAHLFLTCQQKIIAESLPSSVEELRALSKDEAKLDQIVDRCAELIATRSQTSLSVKFAKQRLRYLEGKPSEQSDFESPGKKLSLLTKALRLGAAQAFNDYFNEFQIERKAVLKTKIKEEIFKNLNP